MLKHLNRYYVYHMKFDILQIMCMLQCGFTNACEVLIAALYFDKHTVMYTINI